MLSMIKTTCGWINHQDNLVLDPSKEELKPKHRSDNREKQTRRCTLVLPKLIWMLCVSKTRKRSPQPDTTVSQWAAAGTPDSGSALSNRHAHDQGLCSCHLRRPGPSERGREYGARAGAESDPPAGRRSLKTPASCGARELWSHWPGPHCTQHQTGFFCRTL